MLGTLGPGSHLGAPRLARHQQCPNTRFSRRIVCAQGSDRGEETLSTLDSLLGQQPENKAAAQLEPLVEWWKIRPKQNAPPRQSGMTSGSQGRFIMNEDLLRLSELRVGRKTVVGQQVEVPQVQPLVSWMLLLVNLACYGTYVNIHELQGAEEAQGFASGLLLFPPGQSGGEGAVGQVAHALSACCLAPGPLELALTVWALALVAPRAESLLGYASFAAIYLLSGAAALLAQSQLAAASVATGVPAAAVAAGAQAAGGGGGEGPLGFSGATGAVVGVVVALLLHTWRNRGLGTQAARWASRMASDPRNSPLTPGPQPPSSSSSAPQPSAPTQLSTASSPLAGLPVDSAQAALGPGPQTLVQPLAVAVACVVLAVGTSLHWPPLAGNSWQACSGLEPGWQQQCSSSSSSSDVASRDDIIIIIGSSSSSSSNSRRDGGEAGDAFWVQGATGVGVPGLLAGAASGAVLAWGMGPLYKLAHEVNLPEGAMHIPDDVEEQAVVMDRTTGIQRTAAALLFCIALCCLV